MRRKGYEGESRPATLGTTVKAHLLLLAVCVQSQRAKQLSLGKYRIAGPRVTRGQLVKNLPRPRSGAFFNGVPIRATAGAA